DGPGATYGIAGVDPRPRREGPGVGPVEALTPVGAGPGRHVAGGRAFPEKRRRRFSFSDFEEFFFFGHHHVFGFLGIQVGRVGVGAARFGQFRAPDEPGRGVRPVDVFAVGGGGEADGMGLFDVALFDLRRRFAADGGAADLSRFLFGAGVRFVGQLLRRSEVGGGAVGRGELEGGRGRAGGILGGAGRDG